MKKPVLVVMAAGMGSRYGGLKQIDPVGGHGEAILDFSLFDAHEAGFETAVIIIKKAIEKDFMEMVGTRLKKAPMEIRYAFQEIDKVPEGYVILSPGVPATPCCARRTKSTVLPLRSSTPMIITANPHSRSFTIIFPMLRTARSTISAWWATSSATLSRITAPWQEASAPWMRRAT